MKILSLFYIIVFVNILHAQNLSLDECIDKAVQSHPDIKKQTIEVRSSQSAIDVAQSDYLPQVTLNAEYDITRTYTLPANGIFNTKDSDGWAVGATLNQKIWDFSKTTSNIHAQEVFEEISKLTLIDAKALLAYKVKLQYELMIVQRVAIDVREKDLKAKEELYKQAEAFVKNGMKTNADASRFLSSVYVAKDNLAISQANYKKAKMILSLYIDEPIADDVVLENRLNANSILLIDEETILNESPLLRATQKSIKRNGLLYKSTKATHYGSLDTVASYTQQNTLNEYDSSLVGVVYNLPLYSGGRISALVEQSYLNKQVAEATFESTKLSLKEEFETLMIDIDRFNKTIKAKESQLKASKETQTLLEARYKEGLATYIEILDAASLTLDANLGLLQAIYERSSAIHRIEYLQGKSI